jgi:pimeloyl-ACP methyl ester carboxylesterase
MADDMVALLDRLGIAAAHIVGWSDGANIGLDMAIRYPERVRSLVATGGQLRADGLIPERLEWARTLSVDSLAQEWLDFCYRSIASDPGQLPTIIEQIRNLWLTEEYVAADGLATIAAPVLILEGALPDFIIKEHVEEMTARIPTAQLQWIEGTGHLAPREKADAWVHSVLAFLDAVES